MNKKILFTIMLILVAFVGQAKERTIVWNNPATESGVYGDGFFHIALDVTKVELKKDETVVYITALQRSDYPDHNWFQFVSDTYLKVGDTRYALVSADSLELDKHINTKNGKLDMVFHFKPLPQKIKSFDFIEGDIEGAFQIIGIKPVEERWKQLFPSYWRNDQSGDWEIAFLDECAIYQCKYWDYKLRNVNPKTGEAEIILTNGNEELKVLISKPNKNLRTFQIGGKTVVYSMITSRFLPNYPTKDTRTEFVNNGYKMDTITVIGWIKDMPQGMSKIAFEFSHYNFITGKNQDAYADLDTLGRFSVKIPVLNSLEIFGDWGRCFVHTMLEAGKTYFLLYDYKEGRRYFMGDDCRLQNELFKYPLDWATLRMKQGDDLDRYIASVDSLLKAQYANIDALCQANPTLSTRFCKYKKGNIFAQNACSFGQARFYTPEHQLSDNARRYAYDNFWTKMDQPYTLHRDIRFFIRPYLEEAYVRTSHWFNIFDHLDDIELTDNERALLTRYNNWKKDYDKRVDAAPSYEAVSRMWEKDSIKYADMFNQVDKYFHSSKHQKIVNNHFLMNGLQFSRNTLDSLNADQIIRDTYLAELVYNNIEGQRTPLSPIILDTLKSWVKNPLCIEMVENLNNRYLAIENCEFDKLVLKSPDNLKGISDGEALLKKIIEPFKGKFVLLDVWGTWCRPCRDALRHSTEEYARLKDFDIEYLYLANSSPQESWENVIKEYNVSGDNVTHYNLPEDQQSAIERYLNINAFPTYKLFNRNGNLLNIDIDARNLNELEKLLKKLE